MIDEPVGKAIFPMITISKDRLASYENFNLLTATFREFVGRFAGNKIIDSGGNSWLINSAIETERLDPIWLRWLRGRSAPVRIKLDTTADTQIEVEEFRQLVLKKLNKSSWSIITNGFVAGGYRKDEIVDVVREVEEASSIEEIIKILNTPLETL